MSHAQKDTNKPNSFINPFDRRDAEEVWKELLANSEPISYEEMTKQMQEETKTQQNKAARND